MRRFTLLFFLYVVSSTAFGQGNFRSISDGTWSTATIWERDADQNGTYEESPSSVAPTDAFTDGLIEVRNQVTLTAGLSLDELTISSGGELIINSGVTLNFYGFSFSDVLTVDFGGTLTNNGNIDIVDFDYVQINGTLNNTGTFTDFSGGFQSDYLFFNSGSTYNHQYTTTPGDIPIATWDLNSTCALTGYTSNFTPPNNLGQSFGNFNINLTALTASGANPFSLNGNLIDVNGTLTVSSTNNRPFYFATINGSGFTLDIDGDFSTSAGTNVLIGRNTSSGTILNIGGDLTIGGNFILTNTAGDITANITGDFTRTAGNLSATGSGVATLNFEGTSQNFNNSLSITSNINYIIQSGSTFTISNSNFVGSGASGSFSLNSGATLVLGSTSASGALAGNVQVQGTQTYSSGSSIIFNGSGAQTVSSAYPSTSGITTIINNGSGVSLISSVSIGGDLTLTNGNLSIGGNTLTIQGALSGAGSLSVGSTSSLVFSGSGAIGTIPFLSASPSFANLTINRSGVTADIEDNLTLSGALALTQGNLDIRGQVLNLGGTVSGSGNLLVDASSSINITGTGAFGSLQFNAIENTLGALSFNRTSGGTATIPSTIRIASNMTLSAGILTNSGTITMADGSTLIKNSDATFTGNALQTDPSETYDITYVNGPQTMGSEIPTPTEESLGNLRVETTGAVTLNQIGLIVTGDVTLTSGSLSIGSNDLEVRGNWERNGGTMATYSGTVIFNGTTAFTGSSAATFSNIQVTGTASITMPSAVVLNVTGDFQVETGAAFDANGGIVNLNGSTDQDLIPAGATFNNIRVNKSGGAVTLNSQLNLAGYLTMQTATAFNSGGNLVLLSTSDGTSGNASISALPTGASVNGDVTVQRFISNEGSIWRYMSAPVSGATVADWQAYFPITGNFTGASTNPGIVSNSPSLYYFDETLGGTFNDRYVAYPSSGTPDANPLVVGRGYVAFMRDEYAQTTVELTGPVNQGTYNFNVTYTPDGDPSSGYNLVGNPYPSSIDWDDSDWTKAGMGGTIAVKDNGGGGGGFQYWNGSTGGLTNGQIAAGQAFWVQTTSGSANLEANEGVKVNAGTTAEFFRQEKVDGFKELVVSLSKGDLVDKAYLAVYPGATEGYDTEYDALKLDNDLFDFSSFDTDGNKLAINFFEDYFCEKVIKFDISDPTSGSYVLDFTGFENFESGNSFTLIDNYTEDEVNVAANTVYNLSIDKNVASSFGSNRLELHITRDFIDPDLQVQSTSEICSNGIAAIDLTSSQSGILYSLKINGENSTYQMMGDGGNLNFEISSEDLLNGINEVEVIGTREGCTSKAIGDIVMVDLSAINTNTPYSVSEVVCNLDNAYVTFSETQPGVNYGLMINGQPYGEAKIGSGSKISFEILNNDLLDSNEISFQATKGGCSDLLSQTAVVTKSSINADLTVDFPASICAGNEAIIELDGSEEGVAYQLLLNDAEFGSSVNGTGSSITFKVAPEFLSESNKIAFLAKNNNCEVELSQSGQISLTTIDESVSFSTTDVCAGGDGEISIETPQIGANYQLILNGKEYGESKLAEEQNLFFNVSNSDLQEENLVEVNVKYGSCSAFLSQVSNIKNTVISPVITEDGNFLISNYDDGNTWFLDGVLLTGENSNKLEKQASGYYELQVSNGVCSSKVGDNFGVDEPDDVTSITENTESVINVFPNPAISILYVESKNNIIDKIEIVNAKGAVMFVDNLGTSSTKINIESFVNGLYIIRLHIDNKTSTYRFLKTND
ncbi:T9SS type A sorting domain-containing protein [Fulvivirga lutimaris]|uniref:T9SS type A sorting domain-containing protein n=1 Tax=Fulvivirga lutimaris TaxID=1819566 RepID=UPI0012BC37D2|nr:T9SS type A sorting domain-containing protein [Fulvivirga lutimaris]MTI38860.1 T9SS type A sorting domain-containing protein [Fulvivirga lutimaris]